MISRLSPGSEAFATTHRRPEPISRMSTRLKAANLPEARGIVGRWSWNQGHPGRLALKFMHTRCWPISPGLKFAPSIPQLFARNELHL